MDGKPGDKGVTTGRRTRGQPSAKVTLKDVALAAGVSTMTVSNVLHARANVSDALRERVMTQVAALGYVPNRAAQELAGVARPHLGLFYTSVINPFIASVIIGALSAGARLGVDVTIQLAELNQPEDLVAAIRRMEAAGIEGFLFPSPIAELAARVLRARHLHVPAIAIATGETLAGLPSVRSEERQATHDLVGLLHDLGHRRIGHLAGPATQSGIAVRHQAWAEALQAHGITPDPAWTEPSPFRFQDALRAAETLLTRQPRVTAVFAANDTLAAAVLATAQKLGLKVPEQLSVVGYDDAPIAEQVVPALTTVRQSGMAMTERAVERLNEAIRARRTDPAARPGGDLIVPYEIVRRASTAPAPEGSPR